MTQCQLLCLYRGSAYVFGEMSGCLSGQNKDMERWKEPIVLSYIQPRKEVLAVLSLVG